MQDARRPAPPRAARDPSRRREQGHGEWPEARGGGPRDDAAAQARTGLRSAQHRPDAAADAWRDLRRRRGLTYRYRQLAQPPRRCRRFGRRGLQSGGAVRQPGQVGPRKLPGHQQAAVGAVEVPLQDGPTRPAAPGPGPDHASAARAARASELRPRRGDHPARRRRVRDALLRGDGAGRAGRRISRRRPAQGAAGRAPTVGPQPVAAAPRPVGGDAGGRGRASLSRLRPTPLLHRPERV
mmetsp:Transcript_9605/g.28168  ORF Transcript_9605/g.28168 Transcript_9605/m.28168 type:complete len:239 (-) Transcript_9605:1363-2079(-)